MKTRLNEEQQAHLTKAGERRQKQLRKAKSRLVQSIRQTFPDIPVQEVRQYASIVMTDDSLRLTQESLEGLVQPYYPEDSVSRSKLSLLTRQLERDLKPQVQKALSRYGVLQELPGFDQSELNGLMDPEAPAQVL